MAEVTEAQIRKAVERATAEVFSEAKSFDAGAFRVADLHTEIERFSGGSLGKDAAWTISYSTSQIEAKDVLGDLGEAAWTISYSTSQVAMEKAAEVASVSRRAKA